MKTPGLLAGAGRITPCGQVELKSGGTTLPVGRCRGKGKIGSSSWTPCRNTHTSREWTDSTEKRACRRCTLSSRQPATDRRRSWRIHPATQTLVASHSGAAMNWPLDHPSIAQSSELRKCKQHMDVVTGALDSERVGFRGCGQCRASSPKSLRFADVRRPHLPALLLAFCALCNQVVIFAALHFRSSFATLAR